MKLKKPTPKQAWAWAGCGALAFAYVSFLVAPLLGQPAPGLTIALTNTDQVRIVITNGSSAVNYEIYRTPVLGDGLNYPFILHLIGTQGQTSFVANMGIDTRGFFSAAVGSDWDGDGIPNFQDAQPSSTNAGVLSITIDNPLNGANIQ